VLQRAPRAAASPQLTAVRNRLYIFLGILVLLILGVAVLFTTPTTPRIKRSGIFPDGTKIEFLGSAVGGATFTTERQWQKLARRILPPRLQGWIPKPFSGTCSSGTNSVTFYFRVVNPRPAVRSGAYPWARFGAEDDHGFRFPFDASIMSSQGPTGAAYYGLALRAFPRRQPSFRFVFLDADSQTLVSMRLPNPVPRAYPEWTPAPLPQTKSNGPVALALKSLQWARPRWVRVVSANDSRYLRIEPDLGLITTNSAWEGPAPGRMEFRDTTGNAGSYLAPSEKAWRAEFGVQRSRWEDFGPEERLVLTNLPIPKAGALLDLGSNAVLSGVRLQVVALCGPGRLMVTNDAAHGVLPPGHPGFSTAPSVSVSSGVRTSSWGSWMPFMWTTVSGMGDDDELRVRAFNDSGEERGLNANRGYSPGPNGERVYMLDLPFTNGLLARLEMVVSRPLKFEFYVDPKAVRPAAE
jgi:hypothetical protein